jgi:hypothetical protein
MSGTAQAGHVKVTTAIGKMPEYFPGRCVTSILQGPSREEVMTLIKAMDEALTKQGLDSSKIVTVEPDPNGGWKAVVISHNWNPLTWVKEQWERSVWGKGDQDDYRWGEPTKPASYKGQTREGIPQPPEAPRKAENYE